MSYHRAPDHRMATRPDPTPPSTRSLNRDRPGRRRLVRGSAVALVAGVTAIGALPAGADDQPSSSEVMIHSESIRLPGDFVRSHVVRMPTDVIRSEALAPWEIDGPYTAAPGHSRSASSTDVISRMTAATGLDRSGPAAPPIPSLTLSRTVEEIRSVVRPRTLDRPPQTEPPRPIDSLVEGDPDRPYVDVLGHEGPVIDSPPVVRDPSTVPQPTAPPRSVEAGSYPEVPLADGPTYNVEGLLDPVNRVRGADEEPGNSSLAFESGAGAKSGSGHKQSVAVTGKTAVETNANGSAKVSTSETSSEKSSSGIDLGVVSYQAISSRGESSSTTYRLSPETRSAVDDGDPLPDYDSSTLRPGDAITTTDSTSAASTTTGTVGRRVKGVGAEAGITLGTASGQFDSLTVARTTDDTITVTRQSGQSSTQTASVDGKAGAGSVASGSIRDSNKITTTEYTGIRAGYQVGAPDWPDEGEGDDYRADLDEGQPQLDPNDTFQELRGRTETVESTLTHGLGATSGPVGGSVQLGEVYWRDRTAEEHVTTLRTPSGDLDDGIPVDSGTTVTRSSTGGQFVHAGIDSPDVDVTVTNTVDPSGYFAEDITVKVDGTETQYTNQQLRDAARNLERNNPEAVDNPVVQNILNDNSMTRVFSEGHGRPAPDPEEIAAAVDALAAQGPTGTYDEAPILGSPASAGSDGTAPSPQQSDSAADAPGSSTSSASHDYDDAPTNYSGTTSPGTSSSSSRGSDSSTSSGGSRSSPDSGDSGASDRSSSTGSSSSSSSTGSSATGSGGSSGNTSTGPSTSSSTPSHGYDDAPSNYSGNTSTGPSTGSSSSYSTQAPTPTFRPAN